MRRLIVSEFVSVDGVMEAPGGEEGYKHTNWVGEHPADPAQWAYKLDEVLEAGALLLGRVTYESFTEAWPSREGSFADKMNAMPKHVASTTLSEPLEWANSTLLEGDVVAAVSRLKQGEGGDILVAGSRTLVQSLLPHGLIDEYRLMVFPVALGSGRRLFPDDAADKVALRLVDSTAFDNGVALHTYQPAPAA
jgi:dihydrofolate reductase